MKEERGRVEKKNKKKINSNKTLISGDEM